MSPAVSGRPTAGVAAAVTVAAAAGLGTHTLGPVDAMHRVLSDAAVTPSGAIVLGTACAALVVAAGLLAAAARRTRWSGPVRALLALWAAGLIALAVFPTNLPGTKVTTSAVIHRYGAAIAVAVPPLVALLVARTPRLRTVALGTGAMAAGYGLAHFPTILTGVAALPFTGLWERLLLGLVLLLVLLTSAELQQPEVSGSPGPEMSLVHAGRDDEAGGRGDAGEECADGVAEVTPEAVDADGAGAPGGVRDVAEDGEQGRVDQCGTGHP